ncbi:hypothetical protein NXH76_28345 [Blautia schinkii]|nr:hypothetical protein [Blautia schinkii]
MKIDYKALASIATDSTSRTSKANDTSIVLSSYLQLLSNLIYASELLTESEMAMIISSINRWITQKHYSNTKTYGIGKIVQLEWGTNFSPELSYRHPAVIIEEWTTSILVIPTTSTPSKVSSAYHPIYNPTGKWYYRKVGVTEGFAHDCALILNNAKIVSKSRIISVSATISGDLNHKENVFREIRKTMIKNFFTKEWIEHQKMMQQYEVEHKKMPNYKKHTIYCLIRIIT